MLARIRSWWRGRSRIERLLVAIGVPVAAIAALWSARQDRARKAEAAEDAEGGPGLEATTTGGGVHTINTGAPGVGTSDLASFTEAFAGEIGSLEDQLARLEKEFGDTTTERAKRDADRDEERQHQLIPDRDFLIGDRVDRPSESPKRRNDLERLRAAVKAAGHDPRSRVDEGDVMRALRIIGHTPGQSLDPGDIAVLERWHAAQ